MYMVRACIHTNRWGSSSAVVEVVEVVGGSVQVPFPGVIELIKHVLHIPLCGRVGTLTALEPADGPTWHAQSINIDHVSALREQKSSVSRGPLTEPRSTLWW